MTKASVLSNISLSCVAAGMTSETLKPFTTLIFTGQPGNTETVTLDGKVYTFKNVINNAADGEVLIDVDYPTSLSNFKAAVNLGTGSGTKYSSATTISANLTGLTLSTGALTIAQKVTLGGPYTCSETLASGNFSNATTIYTGYKITTAATESLLQMSCYFVDANGGNTAIRVMGCNTSETEIGCTTGISAAEILFGAASIDLRVIAGQHYGFVMVNGVVGNTSAQFWAFGCGFTPTTLRGKVITGATNATPIVITTSAAHGYTTGDSVTIRHVGGNTAANVTNNLITVLTTTTFSLAASVGNGVYTTGGVCGKIGAEIAEAFFTSGTGNNQPLFRGGGGGALSADTNTFYTALNGSTQIHTGSGGTGTLRFITPVSAGYPLEALVWYNGTALVTEPFLAWGTGLSTTGGINTQLYNTTILMKAYTRDTLGTMDSHSWFNLTDNNTGSGALPQGSILTVVP